MTPKQLSQLLAREAETVARHLLPDGKRISHEWRCGSTAGEAGESLGVHLVGDKAGVWADFASGQTGDLLDLWRDVRGITTTEAMREVADWLGVSMDPPKFAGKTPKTFSRPKHAPEPTRQQSAVWTYLTETRGLSAEAIAAFRVGEHKGAVILPFYDETGELVMCKWRSIREKKCGVTEKGMRPSLFGWQAVSLKSRAIVICEGEFDAMAFHAWGIPALSVPYGGGGGEKQAWIEYEFDRLERFDEIFLAMDADDEGRKATAEIIDRLGRHRCRVVELPHKDANECLKEGMTRDAMWRLLSIAKTQDPSELKNAGDYRDAVIAAFHPTEDDKGFLTPWDFCKTLRFRPGEVTLIAGVNGHGKSEACGHLTLEAMAQGVKCCVASMEFKPQKWLARLVRQASGVAGPTDEYIHRIMDWIEKSMWVFDVATTAKVDLLLDIFLYARQRYGVTLFVIDNLTKLNIDMDDYNGQKAFIDRLTDFAKQHDVHVFLVAHLRKGEDDGKPGGKFDVKGSGAITDLADTVLIWWRNRKKEEKLARTDLSDADRSETERLPDAICRCEKQRNGEDEPRINLWWHAPSHQFLQTPSYPPREYVSYYRGH